MSVSNHAIGGQEAAVSIDTTAIECSLSDLGQVRLEMVSGSSSELLWNILVRAYHYRLIGNILGIALDKIKKSYIMQQWNL